MKKVKYNKDTEQLSYQMEVDGEISYSGFNVTKEGMQAVAPEILGYEGEAFVEISDEKYSEIYNKFREERYKTVKINSKYDGKKISVDVDKDVDPKILKVVVEAYEKDQPLYVQYEEGYAYYPSEEEDEEAMYSDNGRAHVVKVGVSTGERKIFLNIEKNQHGGSSFCFSGIDMVMTDRSESKLIKELMKYERRVSKKEVRDALKTSKNDFKI